MVEPNFFVERWNDVRHIFGSFPISAWSVTVLSFVLGALLF